MRTESRVKYANFRTLHVIEKYHNQLVCTQLTMDNFAEVGLFSVWSQIPHSTSAAWNLGLIADNFNPWFCYVQYLLGHFWYMLLQCQFSADRRKKCDVDGCQSGFIYLYMAACHLKRGVCVDLSMRISINEYGSFRLKKPKPANIQQQFSISRPNWKEWSGLFVLTGRVCDSVDRCSYPVKVWLGLFNSNHNYSTKNGTTVRFNVIHVSEEITMLHKIITTKLIPVYSLLLVLLNEFYLVCHFHRRWFICPCYLFSSWPIPLAVSQLNPE